LPLAPLCKPGRVFCPAPPREGGLSGLAGVTTRPAGNPTAGVPSAVERPLHLHHTPSRVPQRWSTTSCREAAPLTPHVQPGTPAVGYHQLSRGSSTYTTRPAGYPSGGVPSAVERQLHVHHTPSRVPQRWGTISCREAAPLTPHAQPGTPAVEYHQLSRGSSTYTTRPAGYPSGGVPPAVERQLHLHHTSSRVPQRWGTISCREAAPLTHCFLALVRLTRVSRKAILGRERPGRAETRAARPGTGSSQKLTWLVLYLGPHHAFAGRSGGSENSWKAWWAATATARRKVRAARRATVPWRRRWRRSD
jgi:hypothetical protein